jgi:peptidoglycan/xylan/chitin deacetylase (PgdA/CDA1 family)
LSPNTGLTEEQDAKALRIEAWLDSHPGFVRDLNRLCPAGPARTRHIPVQYTLKGPAQVYADGNLPDRHILLSFDDGPHLLYTELVLRVLEKCQIRAHFFPVGRQAKRPEKGRLLRRMTTTGHMVGSHSFSHPNLKNMRTSQARKEILFGHAAVIKATGAFRPFFRFPYGSGIHTPRLLKILKKRGLVSMFWNIAVPDISEYNPKKLLAQTLSLVRRKGRGVLLMHDVKPHTLLMLPKLIRYLDEHGYTFAVLDPDMDHGAIARRDSIGQDGGVVSAGGGRLAQGLGLRPPMPAPLP